MTVHRRRIALLLVVVTCTHPDAQAQTVPRPVIHEVMIDPSNVSDTSGEWIELFNPSDTPVSLQGWVLQDDDGDHLILDTDPPLTLQAHGYLVLGRSDDPALNGDVPVQHPYGSALTLANTADEVELLDASGQSVDRLAYGSESGLVAPAGAALARRDADADGTLLSSWCIATTTYGDGSDRGTPGFDNDCPPPPQHRVLINEVDVVQDGPDRAEFIELYDGGAGGTPLDGLVLVRFDGASGTSYGSAIALDGYSTDSDGYLVICGDPNRVPPCHLVVEGTGRAWLQDGPDAVALYLAPESALPPGSTPVLDGLIDALVYGNRNRHARRLIHLLQDGEPLADEGDRDEAGARSMQRLPDGAGGPRITTYIQALPPTPGSPNRMPLPPVVLNEVVADHAGPDVNEFVEVVGSPATDYGDVSVVVLEGDAGTAAGVVDRVLPVGHTDAEGRWTTDLFGNVLENGTLTLLLAVDFTGEVGDDLDSDDDGRLDVAPWTRLMDALAFSDGGSEDRVYAGIVLGPGFDGISDDPGGASRIPDAVHTGSIADWVRNDVDGYGLPAFPDGGTPRTGEAVNTPDAANRPAHTPGVPAGLVLNEIDVDTPGADSLEFIELYDGGRGHTPLDSAVVVLINGATDQVYRAFDLDGHATDARGYFVLGTRRITGGTGVTFGAGTLQNGPDAVALYAGRASDFRSGTPLGATDLVDAIVYGTGDATDTGLLALLAPGQSQVDEAADGPAEERSLQRLPDGAGGYRRTDAIATAPPTPGRTNGGADLSVHLQLLQATVADGQRTLLLQAVCANAGPTDADEVSLRLTFAGAGAVSPVQASRGRFAPETGIWTLDELPAGATATLVVRLVSTAGATLSVLAEVIAAHPGDPNATPGDAQGDDAARITLGRSPTVRPSFTADLELTVAAPSGLPDGNNEITLVVANHGPATTAGVSVRLRWRSGDPAGSYTETLTWPVGRLRDSEAVHRSFPVPKNPPTDRRLDAEIVSSSLPDPDSRAGNGVDGEDDQVALVVPSGVGKGDGSASSAADEVLSAAFPNPSLGSTMVYLDLPARMPIRLEVFDVRGRRIAGLLDGMLTAGRHAIRWDAVRAPPGHYAIRLTMPDAVRVVWVTLIR